MSTKKKGRAKARPSPVEQSPHVKSEDGLLRVNKALARAGVCSRRGADELVSRGRVKVNGFPAEPGMKIDPEKDIVEVDGRRIDPPSPAAGEHLYLALNKPVRVVTTADDPEGRRTVLDLLPDKYARSRVFPVGRLDYFSEGLLVLTNDGDLAHRLMHPRWHLEKVYEVMIRGDVSDKALEAMRNGMELAEGERLAPAEIHARPAGPNRTRLAMTLIQGVNRQIRRMCRDLDLTILKLTRVRQGPVELGSLAPGQMRELSKSEAAALRKAVGLD
jgi:23S rRNA pseudouridine2605 synthase